MGHDSYLSATNGLADTVGVTKSKNYLASRAESRSRQ